ncbi:MAG: hypothetical protein OK441_00440 [Thaumarchaeota archaeon]|nr:hypothetical protein [Nitrososphaerota archaeon]
MNESEAWFAGLIDGEGCFTFSIYHQHHHTLRFDPVFCISMKDGVWYAVVERILREHDIQFSTRRRKNQIEVRLEGHIRVKKLIAFFLPYLVVKHPLALRFLSFPNAPARNRFAKIDDSYLKEVGEMVDFVREFNKGKNRKHKWNSKTISNFYENK